MFIKVKNLKSMQKMTHPEITFCFTWLSVPVDGKVNSYQLGGDLQLSLVFNPKRPYRPPSSPGYNFIKNHSDYIERNEAHPAIYYTILNVKQLLDN